MVARIVTNALNQKYLGLKPADRRKTLESKPAGIIVFVMGGLTLEESFELQEINKSTQGINIISVGTHILSAERWVIVPEISL